MIPKASFWGWLTREGRLKNQWARALSDPDPASSLTSLRQVQQKLAENPFAFLHLWPPFLDTYLDTSRVSRCTDSDLKALEEMGQSISDCAGVSVPPETIWLRVVEAYDSRGNARQARILLTRIYYTTPAVSEKVKTKCARKLAYKGARGDDQLKIYVDHLQHVPDPSRETDVLNLLGGICTVDFDSDNVSLRRAGDVANRIAESQTQVFGVHRALGLHALLIKHSAIEAVKHFSTAFQTNRRDKVAQVGLLAALIQEKDYREVAKMADKIGYTVDPVERGLVGLSLVLAWLNSYEQPGPPPSRARDIEKLDLRKYVGDVQKLVIGRLYLLEGNAKRAMEILQPLCCLHTEYPEWTYYAAWSAALTGDKEGVARCFTTLGKWSGIWTVACLLLDIDPKLAQKYKADKQLEQAPKPYSQFALARLALARSTQPSAINWKPEFHSSTAEHLEALRTMLGYALYKKDSVIAEQTLTMPLFQRLPLADQMLWRGLHLLSTGDIVQGRAILEEAAIKFGYQRAALVLLVHLLEHDQVDKAKQFMDQGIAGRHDFKIKLLQAYVDACEDRTDVASELLDKLTAQCDPRGHYALGNLYLYYAEKAQKTGQLDRAQLYRKQAAGALGKALKTGERSLLHNCEILTRCAEFLAHPHQKMESWAKLWSEVERLPVSRRQPWLVWNAAVAQLWCGNPSRMEEGCKKMLALLESVDGLEDPALKSITQTVAHACIKAESIQQADKLVALLGRLSASDERQAIRHLYQLGVAAAARLRYTKTAKKDRDKARRQLVRLSKTDPGNGILALLLAQANLKCQNPHGAATVMQDALPEDPFEQRLCTCIPDLLQGQPLTLEDIPQVPQDAALEIIQACHLLRAVVAFVTDMPDQGYDAVMEAMRRHAESTAIVFNMGKFLPSLCACSTRGRAVPPTLIEAVRRLAKSSQDKKQTLSVARCLAAIGDIEYACQLWERVLAIDNELDSPSCQEYTRLLCHLAVAAHNSGDTIEAVKKLRSASKLAEGNR